MENNIQKRQIKKGWSRKILRLVFFVVFIFLVSGASLVIIDDYIFPYLATVKWLARYPIFRTATENVVVVNKTEQITVSEDQTISRYSNKSTASVAEIISSKTDAKSSSRLSDKNQVRFGSALIVTADGLMLTYRDAIFEEHSTYKIFTSGDKAHDARLIAVDPYTNMAFLKIDGVEDLPTASFIAPEDIKVGAKVIAIGRNGESFQSVYKAGLVSQFVSSFSLAGPVASSEKLAGVYMADFNMDEEKSERMAGGAVVDYNGNVVGVLGVRKVADQKQYFVIPVNHVEDLVNRYLAEGTIKRATLGVYFLSLDRETAILYGQSASKGAMIFSQSMQQGLAVIVGSAAEKAGLRILDVVISVDGEEVNADQNLSHLISKHKPGEKIDLKVEREGKELVISVVLG